MSLEQLNVKRRTYRRAKMKSAVDKLSSIERLKGIAVEVEQSRATLARLQDSDRQLVIQLARLIATNQLEMYELYTAERIRLAGVINEADRQLCLLKEKYDTQLDVAAGHSRKERKIGEKANRTDSLRRLMLEENRLGDFLMYEANHHV